MGEILLLSRIQFALNIAFHYLFPPLTIGLALILVIMEGTYLVTKKPIYQRMTKFFVHIFAVIFAVGVATGLVQVFAFGTNWARFSHFVGDVFGSILGAEGVFAFFLESGFLALLLFGWNRVGPKTHFFSTVMVCLGSHFSGLWIVVANSWMQTPSGYKIVGEGATRHAVIDSWWAVINNPSAWDRFIHVILGCWLAGAFLVMSISAYYLLKNKHLELAKRSFVIALILASFTVIAQGVSGDSTGRGVAKNHPIKLAAMEGVYETVTPTPIYVFGSSNPKEGKTNGLAIPGLLSFLVYRNFNQAVPGLDQFPKELWPPVGVVFQFYHGMLFMWGLMLLGAILGWVAVARWRRGRRSPFIMCYSIVSVLFPEIANQMGWYTAEIGRQPWVVYGLLKTSEGVSLSLVPGQVVASLIMFVVIYALIFALFVFLLDRKIKAGPPDYDSGMDQYRDPYLVGS
ncbi:MAG: Cytochrome bd ubiquinol oxidase subunit 1 [Chlamydiales bacterium]|nr:Cytochrome bd ubiquinol oxidase subunit 1 [Chlamydiales bacterium]MCH9635752.1 Cytochrome bd ubiquinol oxidase subunit 1 [Chlamydiales bacterium]